MWLNQDKQQREKRERVENSRGEGEFRKGSVGE